MRSVCFSRFPAFAFAAVIAMVTLGSAAVAEEKEKLNTGPKDSREQVSPGPIDDDADAEFKTTDSGLQYRILRKGDGEKPSATSSVTVHYKGWLDNEKIFDSSYRRGDTTSFGLNQVIPGWTEGLQLVSEGGMIELIIPSKIGYGSRGAGAAIPPDATLHFLVELMKVR